MSARLYVFARFRCLSPCVYPSLQRRADTGIRPYKNLVFALDFVFDFDFVLTLTLFLPLPLFLPLTLVGDPVGRDMKKVVFCI